MARDPRKNSAYDSGLRGREKPGGSKQGANTSVGNPDGEALSSAHSSGMRGSQKSASGGATFGQESKGANLGGENKQGPSSTVGHPDGHNDAGMGKKAGIDAGTFHASPVDAHKPGAAGSGNSTELAAGSKAPIGTPGILGEEDDTHINLRIPKSSLHKKVAGMAGSR